MIFALYFGTAFFVVGQLKSQFIHRRVAKRFFFSNKKAKKKNARISHDIEASGRKYYFNS